MLGPLICHAHTAFTVVYRYDSAGQLTGTITPDPDGAGPLHYLATRTTYNRDGQVTRVEAGHLTNFQDAEIAPVDWVQFNIGTTTDTLYDLAGRKVKKSVSSGGTTYQVTQYSYDVVGRLECTAVRMNPAVFGSLPASACTLGTAGSQGPDRITRNVYDAAGQLLKVQRAYGTSLQQDYATYTYSANGKQTSVTDANGNKASMTYDGFDRQTKWNFPSKTTPGTVSTTDYEQYGYDANGNRTSLRKRDGQTIAYTYDALNRVTVKDIPGGTLADVYYGYDLRGLQLYARFASTTGEGLTNAYNGFGRLASSSTNQGGTTRTLSYQWDGNGNRTRVTHPDGTYFTFEYDGLDRMIAVKENGSTTIASLSYDQQGRRAGMTRGGVPTTYGYDAVSRLSSLTDNLSGTAQDLIWGYTYNPASQLATRTRDNNAYAFGGYTPQTRSYAVNGLNQYTSVNTNVYCYDANGNLTADGGLSYKYDVENRLVETRTPVGTACPVTNYTGTQQASLVWNPMGRLYQTAGVSGAGATQFLYDGDELVAEYNGAGTLLRRYVHGAQDDDPLVWYEGATLGQRRSLQSDHQGSIVSVADGSGTAIAINSYDEYGTPKNSANAYGEPYGRFAYTGQAWIPELGMYHYKARIYSPMLGRFLQTDPIGYEDQVNLYAYVANDPVNGRDPSGRYICGAKSSGQCDAVDGALKQAREALKGLKGQAARDLRAAIGAWGVRGKDNGVTVQAGDTAIAKTSTKDGRTTVTISSRLDSFAKLSQARQDAPGAFIAAHEGQHILDERAMGRDPRTPQEHFNLEQRAYALQGQTDRALGTADGGYMPVWRPGMSAADMDRAARENAWSSVCRGVSNCSSVVDMYP